MKCLLLGSAAVSLALLLGASHAWALGTQMMSNSNPDGSVKFADPDEQLPFGDPGDTQAQKPLLVFHAPRADAGGSPVELQPEKPARSQAFSPEEMRLLFGPFNHDGYGGFGR